MRCRGVEYTLSATSEVPEEIVELIMDRLGKQTVLLYVRHRDAAIRKGHKGAPGSVGWMLALVWYWLYDLAIGRKKHERNPSDKPLKDLAAHFQMTETKLLNDMPTVAELDAVGLRHVALITYEMSDRRYRLDKTCTW